jgi:hypothetical protein
MSLYITCVITPYAYAYVCITHVVVLLANPRKGVVWQGMVVYYYTNTPVDNSVDNYVYNYDKTGVIRPYIIERQPEGVERG